MLEYDPYLDPNLIPKLPKEWDDPEYVKKHPEKMEEVTQKQKQVDDALSKLRNDKETNIIFARMDYQLKDGITLNMEREKSYLYLNVEDSQWNDTEAKLKKHIQSIQRTTSDLEKKIIETIDEEKQKSDQGLGFIFG